MIALMITAAITVSAFSVTAFAEEQAPAASRQETVYTDPDPGIIEMTGTWYDAAGNEYKTTIIPKKETPERTDPGAKVSWSDGANTFVRDDSAHTVTVYDANGNVISVMPA